MIIHWQEEEEEVDRYACFIYPLLIRCGIVWSGIVWSVAVWFGLGWCSAVWNIAVLSGAERNSTSWYKTVTVVLIIVRDITSSWKKELVLWNHISHHLNMFNLVNAALWQLDFLELDWWVWQLEPGAGHCCKEQAKLCHWVLPYPWKNGKHVSSGRVCNKYGIIYRKE